MSVNVTTMNYDQALRILLEGTCGANACEIQRHTGLSRKAVQNFLQDATCHDKTRDEIGMFVWRKMNSHVLLCEEDRAT
jgi:hypothetical protein